MNFRFGILAMVSVACIAGSSPYSTAAKPQNPPIAKVLVWVRDAHGAPVSDLRANDFAVTENGLPDRVVGVEKLFSGSQTQSRNPVCQETGPVQEAGRRSDDSARALTHILVLIEPMTAVPRSHAVSNALRFFSTAAAGNWKVALVDDEGNLLRYTQDLNQVRAVLKRLQRHYAPYAPHGPWSAVVQSAIRELGVLPGRHVVILISTRGAMFSSMLAGLAVSSQAAMYTIDSGGPETVVPFGGAADVFQSSEAGPIPFVTGEFAAESLASTLSSMGYINTGLGWSEQVAEETGGLSVAGVKDAFEHISADEAGYYLLSFEARAEESGGTFNAFSIKVNRPHLQVKGPRYYLVPPDTAASQMPAEMMAALQSPQNQKGISVVVNSWLFPDQDTVHWGVFAADLNWLEGAPPKGSRVKIYAELINDSMHGISGTWLEEREWPEQSSTLHWQRDGRVYPGSYMLRVTAMDTASGKIAFGTRIFAARLLDVPAFRFSGVVLADSCLPPQENSATRQNLFDPLVSGDCKMAPRADSRFRSAEDLRVLVRIYPPGVEISRLVLTQWKAYAVVDDMLDKAMGLTLAQAEVRGLIVTGILPLRRLELAAGKHYLTVLFVVPDSKSKTHQIPLRTEFSIAQ